MTQQLSGGWAREGFDSSVYATVLHLHVDIIEGFLELNLKGIDIDSRT